MSATVCLPTNDTHFFFFLLPVRACRGREAAPVSFRRNGTRGAPLRETNNVKAAARRRRNKRRVPECARHRNEAKCACTFVAVPWGVVEVNPLAAGEGGASGPLVCRRKSSRDAPRCACGSPRSGTTETESGKPSRAGGESAGTTAEEARLALTHFDGIPPMWVVGHAAAGDVARPAWRLRHHEGSSSTLGIRRRFDGHEESLKSGEVTRQTCTR